MPPKLGLHPLSLSSGRDALLYVPKANGAAAQPMPLLVSLHGAGGNERHGIDLLRDQADTLAVVLLSPASRRQTWDVIMGDFGPDVEFLDAALERTFQMCNVDTTRCGIGGFSDGASYALSLGLGNGDLFTHILAFSPGFTAHASMTGKPRIFVSHGTRDSILPIDSCSRRLVPQLRAAGYRVDYREFHGPHTVPSEMATAAVEQLAGTPAAR
jgi:phospholipase/carboxylesterase